MVDIPSDNHQHDPGEPSGKALCHSADRPWFHSTSSLLSLVKGLRTVLIWVWLGTPQLIARATAHRNVASFWRQQCSFTCSSPSPHLLGSQPAPEPLQTQLCVRQSPTREQQRTVNKQSLITCASEVVAIRCIGGRHSCLCTRNLGRSHRLFGAPPPSGSTPYAWAPGATTPLLHRLCWGAGHCNEQGLGFRWGHQQQHQGHTKLLCVAQLWGHYLQPYWYALCITTSTLQKWREIIRRWRMAAQVAR